MYKLRDICQKLIEVPFDTHFFWLIALGFTVGFIIIVQRAAQGALVKTNDEDPSLFLTVIIGCGLLLGIGTLIYAGINNARQHQHREEEAQHKR